MRLPRLIAFSASLLLASSAAIRAAEDQNIRFGSGQYPLRLAFSANAKIGATLMETGYSETPAEEFDTVLVQGELPDPDARLELAVKGGTFLSADSRYGYSEMSRTADGRFWAKYRLKNAARKPVKFVVVSYGLKTDSAIVIYEAETLKARDSMEIPRSTEPFVYVPDPALSVPVNVPFTFVRRADWQAGPPKEPFSTHTPVAFTIHHTQGRYPQTFEAARQEVQFIQQFHQNGRGWNDIGYHFLVDPAGNVFEGRPVGVIGAHVRNKNTGNVGISILGNYHPPVSNEFTPAAQASFLSVARYLNETYTVNRSSFRAHRDMQDTDCPGDDLYAKVPLLRDLIFGPAQAQPLPPAQPPQGATPAQLRSVRQLMNFLR